MGVGRALEKLLEAIDRNVEIEVVHVTGEEVQFSDQLRAERRPVPLGVVAQIEAVVAHVRRRRAVDGSRQFVPEGHWISVRAHGSIDRLPRLELIARPAVTAEDCLESGELSRRPDNLALYGAP